MKMRFVLFQLFLILCLVLPDRLLAGAVTGTVTDQTSGAPLAGASVIVLETGDSTTTDASGQYLFDNIADGRYTLLVGLTDYQPLILTNVSFGRCCQIVADVNHSGAGPDIADLVFLVSYMFQQGAVPPCMEETDINGSGVAAPDIADLVYLVGYMFQQGPAPAGCL